MVTDFIRHEKIRTTDSKAREVKRLAEKVITLGKKGSLHDRRRAAAFLTDKSVVRKVFEDLNTRYDDRAGGYTRLVKLGPRRGDAAEMAILELIP
jgi:large subunit ribosomal protein L17